jgi:hypothetical protein
MAQTIIRMGGYQGAQSVHTRAGRILGREFLDRVGDSYRFDFREDVTFLGRPSKAASWIFAISRPAI